MRKFLRFALWLIIAINSLNFGVSASNTNENMDKSIFLKTLKNFGFEEFNINFQEDLPNDSNEFLKNFDINSKKFIDFVDAKKAVENFNFQNICGVILKTLTKKFGSLFKSFTPILAIILLYALVMGVGNFSNERGMHEVLNAVVTIAVCMNIIKPLVQLTAKISLIMKCTASFILCYVPICSGIMIISGKPITATLYHGTMLAMGQGISFVSSEFLIPTINSIFGLSIISALVSKSPLKKICELIQKIVIWILGFSITIFVGILSLQSIISGGVDGFNEKIVKFALVNFVPIIGNALSDSFLAFEGGIKLLKTSLGSFSVIAGSAIFIPITLECVVWIFFLKICGTISDTFQLSNATNFLKASTKIMEILFVIILSGMLILTISIALMLIIQN